jgi:hypothetical protein
VNASHKRTGSVSSIYIWSENSSPKSEAKMAEIEELIGRQFQSLSIVFVCAVNTKLARSVPKFRILTSI